MDEWRATEHFVLLAGNIACVLARVNPLAVGTGAVPEDEYDVEAGQIARLLLAEQPTAAAEVGSSIDRVFAHYQIASLAPDAREELVDAIWVEYEALRSGS